MKQRLKGAGKWMAANPFPGRKTAYYHDSVMKCIEEELGPAVPHSHEKPFLSERAKTLLTVLLVILAAIGFVAGLYWTTPKEITKPFESYEYKPIILDHR